MPKDDAVFSVDTHLFRELGDLLVGRDSTALFELIKNAYDADASEVTVVGTKLDDPDTGEIVIADNGCGMNEKIFREGFLRIASRLKEAGDRRSEIFHRRFTGAKGIGRLSAHKLARLLQVDSVRGRPGGRSRSGIFAEIDWDAVELLPTLEDVVEGREVTISPGAFANELTAGTRIVLRRLRRRWTPEERSKFVSECRSFQPPAELTMNLVPRLLSKTLLFSQPTVRENDGADPGFMLNLEGEFDTGESLWARIAATSQWLIEVDAAPPKIGQVSQVMFGIGPLKEAAHKNPSWERRIFTIPHIRPTTGPFFQARIFFQRDSRGVPSGRREIRALGGVRVYVEGFRILPYGEPGNDWLDLDSQVKRRSVNDFDEIVSDLFGETDEVEDWDKFLMPNSSYFGGVFLTQEGASGLRPLINREGFLPDPEFEFIRTTIRQAIQLFTRVRAAATYPERLAREDRRKGTGNTPATIEQPAPGGKPPSVVRAPDGPPESLTATVSHLTERLQEATDLLARGNVSDAGVILDRAPEEIETIRNTAERIAEQGPMIRVLASVGTQMSAFVHEIRSLLGTAKVVEESIERLQTSDPKLSAETRQRLSGIRGTVGELRRHLERQASYLLDIVTPDASRRRSRQKLAERFESGARLLRSAAERRRVEIENAIPADLKTPPMFPAELTSVFSNLLSNAIKAAGPSGRIRASATQSEGRVIVRVENTGQRVRPGECRAMVPPLRVEHNGSRFLPRSRHGSWAHDYAQHARALWGVHPVRRTIA